MYNLQQHPQSSRSGIIVTPNAIIRIRDRQQQAMNQSRRYKFYSDSSALLATATPRRCTIVHHHHLVAVLLLTHSECIIAALERAFN